MPVSPRSARPEPKTGQDTALTRLTHSPATRRIYGDGPQPPVHVPETNPPHACPLRAPKPLKPAIRAARPGWASALTPHCFSLPLRPSCCGTKHQHKSRSSAGRTVICRVHEMRERSSKQGSGRGRWEAWFGFPLLPYLRVLRANVTEGLKAGLPPARTPAHCRRGPLPPADRLQFKQGPEIPQHPCARGIQKQNTASCVAGEGSRCPEEQAEKEPSWPQCSPVSRTRHGHVWGHVQGCSLRPSSCGSQARSDKGWTSRGCSEGTTTHLPLRSQPYSSFQTVGGSRARGGASRPQGGLRLHTKGEVWRNGSLGPPFFIPEALGS